MMIRKNCRLMSLLALILATVPGIASAQGKQAVRPFVVVEGKAQTGVIGLTPAQIRHAYGFDSILKLTQGAGQTIAVINGFYDKHLPGDLAVFNAAFGLPAADLHTLFSCIYTAGGPAQECNNPDTDIPSDPNNPNYQIWALETALDIEWAHAIAPQATIVLVEVQPNGKTPDGFPATTLDDMLGGVDIALKSQFDVHTVSMSWGEMEFKDEVGAGQGEEDRHFAGIRKVTFFAAAGDAAHGVVYPAASPFVMSVGGTKLNIDSAGNYQSEKAWSGSGGGLSQFEAEPDYQEDYPIPNETMPPMRGVPDVAYDAAPDSGVAVYDSVAFQGFAGWSQVGGTSSGTPQWSALVALANSLRLSNTGGVALTGSDGFLYLVAQDLDGNATFHDITNGRDGKCGTLCKAKPGYDYVTGLGTPRADLLIPALVAFPF
jgi:subtilase family serine protease